MKSSENIELLKLLADRSRYRIIMLLFENNGELCVNDIAEKIGVTPSAISHQLARLEANDLVEPHRRGQNGLLQV